MSDELKSKYEQTCARYGDVSYRLGVLSRLARSLEGELEQLQLQHQQATETVGKPVDSGDTELAS